ncbi:CvpA family protein [Chitinophaga japonensis]|uniref:Colicin V production protein n=1 Tax=Chitinophaga japonensis TaxID=104662 RepID=A0A562SSC2_CHIJA|nr:CvpA family protein [Chitinophaga japonensis]TWI84018.1 colicin V production protein [Chitinophaga japonensis]
MNIIDILLFLVILLAVYAGYQKGFILGALDLLLLVLSLLFAFWSYRYIVFFFEHYITSLGVWTPPLAFLLAYAFVRILLAALAGRLVKQLPARANENTFNKAFGLLPGAINGIIYAALISAILIGMPLFDTLSAKTRESAIARALTPHVEWAEDKLAPVFDEAVNHGINHLSISPGFTKSVDLPFTVKAPEARQRLEAEMLGMLNEERRKNGLDPLKADPEMKTVARSHSQDMLVSGYFSHIDLEGQTPSERMREAGVRFLVAGENLALSPTLQLAHNGLMNSPGHRANILNPSFGRVGIGILDGGKHGLMVTQNFRN